MNKVINSEQKYETYKMLMGRLKVAIHEEFWYEAIFLEYAMLEDRLHSVIIHGGETTNNRMIDNIKKVRKMIEKKKSGIEKYFDGEILSEVNHWRDKRNGLVHSLATKEYDNDQVKKVAQDGYDVIKRFSNKTTNYRRYLERRAANGSLSR